jgi:hypothetical protein
LLSLWNLHCFLPTMSNPQNITNNIMKPSNSFTSYLTIPPHTIFQYSNTKSPGRKSWKESLWRWIIKIKSIWYPTTKPTWIFCLPRGSNKRGGFSLHKEHHWQDYHRQIYTR